MLWPASRRATFGNGRSLWAYLGTFTYDYHGRIKSQSRVINGRTTTMTVNEFDQLDRPFGKPTILLAGQQRVG